MAPPQRKSALPSLPLGPERLFPSPTMRLRGDGAPGAPVFTVCFGASHTSPATTSWANCTDCRSPKTTNGFSSRCAPVPRAIWTPSLTECWDVC
uniref:Uncharacterized protein n=1 Tax=Oryza glumipatula TaxID=40148 RepID=A0A0D9Y943_9ORYZ